MTFERQLSEAYSAQRKLPQIASAATAPPAPIVHTRSEQVEVQTRRLSALHRFLVRLALLLFHPKLCVSQGSF